MNKLGVGIKFRDSGKVCYYPSDNFELTNGDSVIVQTVNGIEFGKVVLDTRMVPEENLEKIFQIQRKATDEDLKLQEQLLENSQKAREIFDDQVKQHNLRMKLIDITSTFDEKKIIFYYTAEGRVDFRDLVRDLAGFFHARIELRQIGVRDEARKYCGIGVCGRKCCCSCWLSDFVPVSIKMAKEQNLSLNSTKISGVCGRLLCCLKYEEDFYEEVSKKMPNIGDELMTPLGMGTVYKLNTLDQAVLMKIVNDRDEVEIKKYTLEELEEAKNKPVEKKVVKPDPPAKPEVKTSQQRKPRRKTLRKRDLPKPIDRSKKAKQENASTKEDPKRPTKSKKPFKKASKKRFSKPSRKSKKPWSKPNKKRRPRRNNQAKTQ